MLLGVGLLALLVFVLIVSFVVRKWPVAGLITAAILFVLSVLSFQETGTFAWQAAHMFDATAASQRALSGLHMLAWLAMAAWALTRVIQSKNPAALKTSVARGLQSLMSPAPADSEVLTNDAVVALVQAHLSDELILQKLKFSRCAFSLSSGDMTDLRAKGVSDRIVGAMLEAQAARGTSSAQAQAPATPHPDTSSPVDPTGMS